MVTVEAIFFWAAVIAYAFSTCFYLYGVGFQKEKATKIGLYIAMVGFICHTAAIGFRWADTGHIPVMRDYENSLAGSWVIVLTLLVLQYRFKTWETLGTVMIPFSLLMMGYGALKSPVLEPLTPPYKSTWLFIHVFFAWVSYTAFTLASSAAVLYLLKESRRRRSRTVSQFYQRLPSLEVLDNLSYRSVLFGFVANAVMIATGAIWANRLWGSYWSWDPVETWSLITWLAYGLYLHLRLTFGWRGRKAAWLAIVALLGVMMSFWGVQFVPTTWHLFRSL